MRTLPSDFEFDDELFVESSGTFIVHVFKGGVDFKFGILKQAFESLIFAVSFFVLNEQSDEFVVREFGVLGCSNPFFKTFGHAKEFELVECG